MEHRPIACAERHQRRRRGEQSIRVREPSRGSIALVCPSMGLSGVDGECRSGNHDHRTVRESCEGPGDRMDTFAATIEPFAMQDGVDRIGRRNGFAFPSRPGLAKPPGRLASAGEARPMARGECDGLIEKEQLGPTSPGHDDPAAPFVFAAADEPGFARPAPVQQGLCRRIVNDAAIAGEHAPLGYGHDLAEGCDAVLEVHHRRSGLAEAQSRLPGGFDQSTFAHETPGTRPRRRS
jgi:hypothetical protein